MSEEECKCKPWIYDFILWKKRAYGGCLLKRFIRPLNRLERPIFIRKQLGIQKHKGNKQKIWIKTQSLKKHRKNNKNCSKHN
jgi:hypothetical protein